VVQRCTTPPLAANERCQGPPSAPATEASHVSPSSFGAPAVAASLVRCAVVSTCHLSCLGCEQCSSA
jgi:hypothetical protein